jgi:hypothetical protein
VEIFQAVTTRRSIRKFRPDPVPEGKAVIIGAALGYSDTEAPVNRFARERAAMDEYAAWVR